MLLVAGLSACSTTSEQLHPDLQTARSNFNNFSFEQTQSERLHKLQKIQKTFAAFADVEYLIKIDLILADLYYLSGHAEQAKSSIEQCKQLANVAAFTHYLADCYLLQFRHTKNTDLLRQLEPSQLTQRQLAYWYFYLNDLQNLSKQLTKSAHNYPADAAYLYYQLGFVQQNVSDAERALTLARQHKLFNLVTDSLFLLSKLNFALGEAELSTWYFSLALASAKANAPQLVDVMQQWYDTRHQVNL